MSSDVFPQPETTPTNFKLALYYLNRTCIDTLLYMGMIHNFFSRSTSPSTPISDAKISPLFFSFNFVSSLPFFLFCLFPHLVEWSTRPSILLLLLPVVTVLLKKKVGRKKTKHLVHLLSSSFFVMSVQNKPTHLFFSSGNTPPLKKMVDSSGFFKKFSSRQLFPVTSPAFHHVFILFYFFKSRNTNVNLFRTFRHSFFSPLKILVGSSMLLYC